MDDHVETSRSASSAIHPNKAASPLPKLSVNQMTTYRWSLLDDVVGYRDAGIEAVGLWRPKLIEFGEERSIELLKDSGLAVSSLSWAGGFTGSNGCTFQEALDDAREAVRLAGLLNAGSLIVVSGARAGHTSNHARRLLLDALRELADFAAEQNVALAVEPMHPMFAGEWTFLNTLEETLDVLDRCNHPFVRMAFDVYHLWQERELLQRIPQIVSQVSVVQLSDWREPPASDNDRHMPGTGIIPLGEIVAAFVDAGYEGFFDVEIWSEHLWTSNYADLLNQCREQFLSIYPSQG
jgi:sugar phosphate isomerase/epimerase